MTDQAPTLIDNTLEPSPRTEPVPPLEQRPAFELATASLWVVLVAFRPAPNVPHVHIEMQLVTATASGEEVYPIAITRTRELSPGALDVMVVSVQRRGDVTGTVLRQRRTA